MQKYKSRWQIQNTKKNKHTKMQTVLRLTRALHIYAFTVYSWAVGSQMLAFTIWGPTKTSKDISRKDFRWPVAAMVKTACFLNRWCGAHTPQRI